MAKPIVRFVTLSIQDGGGRSVTAIGGHLTLTNAGGRTWIVRDNDTGKSNTVIGTENDAILYWLNSKLG